jgi:hypothetical protein
VEALLRLKKVIVGGRQDGNMDVSFLCMNGMDLGRRRRLFVAANSRRDGGATLLVHSTPVTEDVEMTSPRPFHVTRHRTVPSFIRHLS